MIGNPDRPICIDTEQCLKDIQYWYHYDNWQNGEYRNENNSLYGPIVLFNANIEIVSENLNPTERDESYKEVWGKYENWYSYKFCDFSKRRMEYLKELSKRKEIKYINIKNEFRDKLIYVIKNGIKIEPNEIFCKLTHENDCQNIHSNNNDCIGCSRWNRID